MIGLLLNRRLLVFLAGASLLAGAVWWIERSGYQRALQSVSEAREKAQKETTEAIKNAPVFTPSDPDARRLLCDIAGFRECDM